MADRQGPAEDPFPDPVVRHGRVPDPAALSPARGDRPVLPRRRSGPQPGEARGPVLRRDRDPLPDGYAPWFRRRRSRSTGADEPAAAAAPTQASGPDRPDQGGRPRTERRRPRHGGPEDEGSAGLDQQRSERPRTARGDTAEVFDTREVRSADGLEIDPAVDPFLASGLAAQLDPTLTPESSTPLLGPEPGPLQKVRRKLGRALVPGERILVAQTRHWVVLTEPVGTPLAFLLAVAAVSPSLGPWDIVRNVLMIGWLVLFGRAVWAVWQWSHDFFVVTDRRLIRLHGIFDVQRDMMPLTKVTDMSFERPFWGRPFNYGRFVLESAGQDQALRVISYVRDPDNVDALIGRQIFSRPMRHGSGGPGR